MKTFIVLIILTLISCTAVPIYTGSYKDCSADMDTYFECQSWYSDGDSGGGE